MGMSKRSKLEHEGDFRREAVADLLDQLAAGLRSGTVNLALAGEHLTLEPADYVQLELCAKRKGERQSIALELDWVSEPKLVIETNMIAITSSEEPDEDTEVASEASFADLRLDAELLAALDKQRLYRLAQAVGIEGRSQLSKTALARAVAERDHGRWLDKQDLLMVATRLEVDEPHRLASDDLVARIRENSERR
jgi:amphi-Trp domain-containing protein